MIATRSIRTPRWSASPTIARAARRCCSAGFDARTFVSQAAKRTGPPSRCSCRNPVSADHGAPDFDSFDLSAFVLKTYTSAPFSAALNDPARWRILIRILPGMTEGGGTAALLCNMHDQTPHRRHAAARAIRLIDDANNKVLGANGRSGRPLGRRDDGRIGRAEATRDTWHDAEGNRYIRHGGDVGRFDGDFLILMDRKDLISGGFNIYPSDLGELIAPGGSRLRGGRRPVRAMGRDAVGFFTGTGDRRRSSPGSTPRSAKLAGGLIQGRLPRNAVARSSSAAAACSYAPA